MIAKALVAITILCIIFCAPVAVVFGILEGTHSAVSALATMIGAATVCAVGAIIEVNRNPPETV